MNGRDYLGVINEPDDDDYAGYETTEQRRELAATHPALASIMRVSVGKKYPEMLEYEKAQDEYNRMLWRASNLT